MSRHQLDMRADAPVKIDDLEIVLGWDAPLRTFFAYVKDLEIERASDDDPILIWVGTRDREITDVAAILAHVEPWAIVPARLRSDLEAERSADDGRQRHPLAR